MIKYFVIILLFPLASGCVNKPIDTSNESRIFTANQDETKSNPEFQKTNLVSNADSSYVALFDNDLKVIYVRSFEYRQINFLYKDSLLHSTKFPSQEEVSGISMNYVRNEDDKLVISFDYGSVNYYDKALYFNVEKEEKTFTLYRVKESTFNKGRPENVKQKDVNLKSKLPLKEFELVDFID